MTEERLAGGGYRIASRNGECLMSYVAPGVLLVTFRGHMDAEITHRIIPALDRIMDEHPKTHYFSDSEAITRYDSDFRVAMTDFVKRNDHRLACNHILVGSKLVAMGVAVGNMLTGGGLQAHSNRQAFERELVAVGGPAVRRRHSA